jgi:6-phosphofructokinase 1
MTDNNLTQKDFEISKLCTPKIESPLGLSTVLGDDIANYVDDSSYVLYEFLRNKVVNNIQNNTEPLAFELAGPRQKIYFDPSKTNAAVVTCGGLCPGINNVIRALVLTLTARYGVKNIFGIKYGYEGFIPRYNHEPVMLTPEFVDDIHYEGGSVLGSSRGHQPVSDIVDCLERMHISILFTIGGDGTLSGAYKIFEEVKKRGLKISVIGVPKTIDNDINYVEKTFGLETAFEIASTAVHAAHTEARGASYGIGLVKVMGRMSGYIAANAALAFSDVNYCLIPEVPFELEGEKGFFSVLEKRLSVKDHVVIIVAEGAGQDLLENRKNEMDMSGNPVLSDIGIFLKNEMKKYFREKKGIPVNIKYIDPSYMVRAVPANAHDSIYCLQLAQNAAHAAMSGRTGMLIGTWNNQFTHVPLKISVSKRKELSPEDPLWLSVLSETGQPISMVNG